MVTAGEGENVVPVPTEEPPVNHWIVPFPEAVNEAAAPWQIVVPASVTALVCNSLLPPLFCLPNNI